MIDLIRFYYKGKDKMGFTDFFTFNDFKIVLGGSDKQNRSAVENKNLDILLSPEIIRGRDFMHSRDSGLNQVLCTLAYKNNIAIGFNFSDVLKTRNRYLILGKMMQNVRLCRKYKVRMAVISGANNEKELKSARDLFSFAVVLGMNPGEAKKALGFTKKEKIK